MKPSSEVFLRQRPGCTAVRVTPRKLHGAVSKQCFQNCFALCNAKPQRYTLRSGWLVGDDLGALGTIFIPHYWVFNSKTDKHLDPTPRAPGDVQDYEYLLDMDILRQITPAHVLPVPLRLNADQRFEAIVPQGVGPVLESMDIAYLFTLHDA